MAPININKNSNIAHVNSALDIGFFYKWLSFLTPFHHLTKLEMTVLASFLNKRHNLAQLVRDELVLDNLLKSIDTRKEIRDEIGLTTGQFNIMVSKLKKSGVMKNNKIDKHYIPNIEEHSGQYRLILIFDIDEKYQSKNHIRKQADNGNGEEGLGETESTTSDSSSSL